MTASIREGSVRADGIEIKYLEAGAGEPVIYLHGAAGLRLTEAHRRLAESNRLIAFQIPPLDALEEKSPAQKLAAMATTFCKTVAALGLEEYSLMGHCIGADLALRIAVARREELKALVLIAPTAILPPSTLPMARVAAEPPGGRPAVWFNEDVPPELASRREKFFEAFKHEGRNPLLEADMGEINLPVLVLFGTSDEIVSTDAARVFSSLLPKCYTVMVYDATHDIETDRPEAVAAVVSDFLAHGEGFMINRSNAIINP